MNPYLKSAILLLVGVLFVMSTFMIEYYLSPEWLIEHWLPYFFPASEYVFFFPHDLAPTSAIGIALVFSAWTYLMYRGVTEGSK